MQFGRFTQNKRWLLQNYWDRLLASKKKEQCQIELSFPLIRKLIISRNNNFLVDFQ